MMTIIIELFSFLFWCRMVYGGTSPEDCKVSTTNTNNYMCPDLSGVFDISATNLGCAQTNYEPGSDSSQVTTVISCDDVSKGYVIDCIAFASLGMVAGNCGQLNTGYVETGGHPTPSWCAAENNVCCFGDDTFYINVHQAIGAECKGQSKCEIEVDQTGFSINGLPSPFSTPENNTLGNIHGDVWGLKVLFQCAPAGTIDDTVEESEFFRYEFDLNDNELSGITDLDIQIIGNCEDGHERTINPEGDVFNECVYDLFRFKVYSGDDFLDDTRWWKIQKNAPNCGTYEGSLPVDIDGRYYNVGFTVTKSGC